MEYFFLLIHVATIARIIIVAYRKRKKKRKKDSSFPNRSRKTSRLLSTVLGPPIRRGWSVARAKVRKLANQVLIRTDGGQLNKVKRGTKKRWEYHLLGEPSFEEREGWVACNSIKMLNETRNTTWHCSNLFTRAWIHASVQFQTCVTLVIWTIIYIVFPTRSYQLNITPYVRARYPRFRVRSDTHRRSSKEYKTKGGRRRRRKLYSRRKNKEGAYEGGKEEKGEGEKARTKRGRVVRTRPSETGRRNRTERCRGGEGRRAR